MKKRRILIALCLCAALALGGCKGAERAAASKLSFSDATSIEALAALDGKPVQITGYMATLSPLDGEYVYLMNMPYQSCPFCVPNTTQLANTMAVYAADGVKFEFTDRPIQITGTLKLEDRVDGYGYTYNYFIDDARYAVVDLSEVSAEYAVYQSLAEDGVIADVNAMFDYLMFICQWTEYTGSYTDESGSEVSYFLYPGDVERILEDAAYGYATEASEDYFPGLIRRVQAVSATELTELTEIISDAQAVERRARAELSGGNYAYDAAQDKYVLNDSDDLYNQFYAIYLRFSEWLATYEL